VHLKSIDILGFKSFADKTQFEFSDGITALLGPNGCGKSNVVDAVKWVLGEQSTKNLRADKMEDVIFSGTESRKALNVAEVTLTLANHDQNLPLEIGSLSEISVKRRLFRSGDSEYYINNTQVRLKELRELFFDTGIGKTAYSIMEQGKIDQILSNRPDERRYIFEEAAGITKFRAKGVEAGRKLVKTEENMQQVKSILSEVKRNHDTLKRQSEKTEEFRKLKENIFQLELAIQLLRLKSFMEQKSELENKLTGLNGRRENLKSQIENINDSLEENIDRVNSMESRLIENQKNLYRIELENSNKESQIRMLEERSGDLKRKISQEEERERAVTGKMESIQGELTKKKSVILELKGRIEEIEKNIIGFDRDIQQYGARINNNESTILNLASEETHLEEIVDKLRAELREIIEKIVTQLDQELKEIGYSVQARKEEEEKILFLIKSIKIQIAGKKKLLEDFSLLAEESGNKKNIMASTILFMDDSLELLTELAGLFNDYQQHTPSFLEDFLAPEGIITQKRKVDQEISDQQRIIMNKRRQSEELREENRSLSVKIEEYRSTLEELRVSRAQMTAQKASHESEIERLLKEYREQEELLKANNREMAHSRARMVEITDVIKSLSGEIRKLEEKDKQLKKEIGTLEKEIVQRNEKLHDKDKHLKLKVGELGKLQSGFENAQVRLAETNAEIRNLYQNFNDQHSRDLNEFESKMFQINQSLKALRSDLANSREELRKLGQVNLMAPEEFAEVHERYQFLSNQINDLTRAKEDLKRITEEIRFESSERFLETYKMIRKNFHIMFRRLFGGGRAELRLTSPGNVLESGVDIFAQPPGKRLENISLLSGGERSLTAVALLFATYMVKPSPFCILDEIDAALDDQNIARFVDLLKEFAHSSQFIVVTHNKKTVASAGTMLGITMEESGVSTLIAIRLEKSGNESSYG
jgi:chromosome segregation protein